MYYAFGIDSIVILQYLLLKVIVRNMLFIRTDNSPKCIFAAFPRIKIPYCILENMRL